MQTVDRVDRGKKNNYIVSAYKMNENVNLMSKDHFNRIRTVRIKSHLKEVKVLTSPIPLVK